MTGAGADGADRSRGPLGHAVDLCVLAPLGFAAEARTLVPELVARGRGQVATAKVVGRFALGQAGSVLAQVPGKALGTLCGLRGSGPEPAEPVPGAGDHDPDQGAAPTGPTAAPGPAPTPTPTPAEAAPVEPAGDPASLAIPDYDSLSASQVVPRLESLDGDELEAVRRYESGTRARRTILSRVHQLQHPEG